MLVTGAAGFIGVNFVRYWLAQNPGSFVVALDALTYAGNLKSLQDVLQHDTCQFVHGDIRDTALIKQLLIKHDIDTLVHFAAESHVDRSIAGADPFIDTNIVGTHSLLKAAKAVWLDSGEGRKAHRFHHVSTDEVFGALAFGEAPFTESTPYAPNSPYAASKAASDHLVRSYTQTYGLDAVTSHCSNNYGPYQFPEKLIPLVLINILHGRPLPVYGDGLNVRDWLYVEDHCRAIELCLRRGEVGKTYNIGGGEEHANIAIVKALCAQMDARLSASDGLLNAYPRTPVAMGQASETLIRYVDDRPGHDRRYAIDESLIRRDLGYWPTEDFATGLQKTIDWYLAQSDWWMELLDVEYQDWLQQQYAQSLLVDR